MKFKDKVSGEVVEFHNQVDIDSMEHHPGYEAVEETATKAEKPKSSKKESVLNKLFKE
jgi:hypothetical protein